MSSKRFDEQFPLEDTERVLPELREFMRALEARMIPIEAQGDRIDAAIETVRAAAITRINDVLEPAYLRLIDYIESGFSSTRINDSGAYGRGVLKAADRATLIDYLNLQIADVDDAASALALSQLTTAVNTLTTATSDAFAAARRYNKRIAIIMG